MKRSPLKPMSDKRRKEARIYSKLRKEFLEEHPYCEAANVPVQNCEGHSEDVHHIAYRGKNYLNVETWLAVSRVCHTWIHEHPNQARKLGYLR